MKTSIYFILSLIILSRVYGQEQDFEKVQIKTIKLTESIYMLEGSGGNIGIFTGEEGTFMIDDQYAPLSDKIKGAVNAITDQPVKFIINTHYHGDHTGGNATFASEGAIILAHHDVRKTIQKHELEELAPEMKESYMGVGLPKITFQQSMKFYFNGESIHAYHFGKAHTGGDVVIYFEKARIFHMGDVFVRYGFPYIDIGNGGTIIGMIQFLNQILEIAPDDAQFIPGHGQPASKKEVEEFKLMLETVCDRVNDLLDEGKTTQEILDSDPTRGFEKRGVGVSDFIGGVIQALNNR